VDVPSQPVSEVWCDGEPENGRLLKLVPLVYKRLREIAALLFPTEVLRAKPVEHPLVHDASGGGIVGLKRPSIEKSRRCNSDFWGDRPSKELV
jgi:hypothetical protein